MLPLEEIRRKIDQTFWFHRYEIVPGVETPGFSIVKPKECLDNLGVPLDLSGKRALDIGAWDGPYTFELESRGAAVTALDIQDPDHTGFNVSKEILGSNAEYVRASAYDIKKNLDGKFDIILFLGVFYHLKHPILALEEIAEALEDEGTVYFEGECLRNYAEDLRGAPVFSPDMEILADSEVPVTLCYPATFKGPTCCNWFIPNFACLRVWFYAAGLEILDHDFFEDKTCTPPVQRVSGKAVKFGNPLLEHDLMPSKGGIAGRPVTSTSEKDRGTRVEVVRDLREQFEAREQDRQARLEVTRELREKLRISEEDRQARLEVIQDLASRLASSEEDRAARLGVIQRLEGEMVRLQQQYDGLHQMYSQLQNRLPVKVLHKLNLV